MKMGRAIERMRILGTISLSVEQVRGGLEGFLRFYSLVTRARRKEATEAR